MVVGTFRVERDGSGTAPGSPATRPSTRASRPRPRRTTWRPASPGTLRSARRALEDGATLRQALTVLLADAVRLEDTTQTLNAQALHDPLARTDRAIVALSAHASPRLLT